MSSLLDEVMQVLDKLPEDALRELHRTRSQDPALWIPNPGPQTESRDTLADELFMGGSAGGGKSSLLCGIAVTEHHNSIIFRREFPQVKGLEDEVAGILGSRDGYNASTHVWRLPGPGGRTLEFGSVPHEKDVEKHQGRPRDLIGFDEITHFSRAQYTYLIRWNRTVKPGQRVRVIVTGNPPTTPEGLWVISYWAPWLDNTHPDPAKPGELRWVVRANDDDDNLELFFRSEAEAVAHQRTLQSVPRDHRGNILPPRSRTFIPANLKDNPDLMRSGYAAVLEGISDRRLREALSHGIFRAELKDDEQQVIPTAWIIAAQKRWTPRPPHDAPMVAIGVDVAQGGDDKTTLARRHDAWFDTMVVVPGSQTPKASDVAALVVRYRRDNAGVVIDVGGGYGGGVCERLEDDQGIATVRFDGSKPRAGRTADRALAFYNWRAMAYWRLREALDPDQPGGSPIALPDDPVLRSDLAAVRYRVTPRGILLEEKSEIRKRIGRSIDCGDAVVMCWTEGQAALTRAMNHMIGGRDHMIGSQKTRSAYSTVGYADMKRRRRGAPSTLGAR